LTGVSINLETKVAAITMARSDIVFLSDVRLVNNQGIPNEDRVRTAFRDAKNKSYESLFNSSKNGRGVGILIANELNCNIEEEIRDPGENFLAIRVSFDGKKLILTSVYGPNNTDRKFFSDLERAINQLNTGNLPIIMGGDWNTTWDSNPVQVNIDTFQMANNPNPQNCALLKNMCNNLNLCDPYRLLYPNKRDYTYQPFGNVRLNRSRIDFFCISESITNNLIDCTITSSVLCSLFDHKNIRITFGIVENLEKTSKLSNQFLDHPILKAVVTASSVRCHLFAVLQNSAETSNLIRAEKEKNAIVWEGIKRYIKLEIQAAKGEGRAASLMAAAELTNIELLISEFYPMDLLYRLEKRCSNVEFFNALVDEVKKSSVWAQKRLFQITKEKILALENKVSL